jgi:hypothetical protein
MTIEQIVEIPADRRLVLDLPREIPTGRVRLTFTPVAGGDGSAGQEDTPLTDWLSGILSRVGDISPEEIRSERLRKYL